jgi:hypothetical protein
MWGPQRPEKLEVSSSFQKLAFASLGRYISHLLHHIEQNPVVKGLVDSPEQWDASSANYRDVITDPWALIYD